jgi:PhnB protein
MSVKKLNPYIHFNGTAEKAIKLYEKALGAKTEALMRYGEAPGSKVPDNQKNRVMHSVLKIGNHELMVSDGLPDSSVPAGGNTDVALEFEKADELKSAFDALAAGGKVTHPLQDMFWGGKLGMLSDAYGVHWILTCENKAA